MTMVLVTRPRQQQANFLALCQARGLDTHCLPLIRIQARPVDDAIWQMHLESPNTAWIFTSRNAVEHCPFDTQPTGAVFAMGASTARALEQTGRTLAVEPEVPFNSEALVAQLKYINANSAVVVTGLGGRAYLGRELRSMHWDVTEVACYERHPERHSEHVISEALNAADIISLTSIESMDALRKQSVNIDPIWKEKPLIVNSERALKAARKANFSGVIEVAVPAGDSGQIEAIERVLMQC